MKLVKVVLLCATVWASLPPSAKGAEFDILRFRGVEQVIVMVTGEITEGDAYQFRKRTEGIERATVALSGPGGLLSEAFAIGAQVHQRNFATLVAPQEECYSACALIWIAGRRRYLSNESMIGVHGAYQTGQNGVRVSAADNAEIGAYLAMLGLRMEAVRYFTTAPPDAFLPVTPDIARRLGIDVYEQDGFEVTTPQEMPSIDSLAFKVVKLVIFSDTCSGLLEINPQSARAAGTVELKRGHEEFGFAAFLETYLLAIDAVKKKLREKGSIRWCMEAIIQLTNAGLDIGIEGPSYDCTKASHPTEKTICEDLALSGLDRLMGMLYYSARRVSNAADKHHILQEQRAFLKRRNACATDIACIERLYSSRILALAE